MQERRTFQGAWEFTDRDPAGNYVTRQFMGYSKREAKKLFRQELRGYELQFWADGFGVWHGRADFYPAIGNCYRSRVIMERARAALIRGMRNRIRARQDAPLPRMTWDVVELRQTGNMFHLWLEMKEGTK